MVVVAVVDLEMALQSIYSNPLFTKSVVSWPPASPSSSSSCHYYKLSLICNKEVRPFGGETGGWRRERPPMGVICALDRNSSSNSSQNSSNDGNKGGVPNSNYVVPLDKSFSLSSSSCITRPLAEILRDLNKRIPENIIGTPSHAAATDNITTTTFIPWYLFIYLFYNGTGNRLILLI